MIPKAKNPNFERGSFVHQVINHAILNQKESPLLPPDACLGASLIQNEGVFQMTEEVEADAKAMTLELWDKLQEYEVIHTEKSISLDIGDGWIWKAKLDSIIKPKVSDELWQGEYKSTKVYASNLKRLYHTSIQPFLYLHIAREMGFDLKGTKMFVADKKACVVEDITCTPQQLKEAARFIKETKERAEEVEAGGVYPRNRTACISLISECPYRPLCVENAAPSYIEECANLMYVKESPIAHYGEGE